MLANPVLDAVRALVPSRLQKATLAAEGGLLLEVYGHHGPAGGERSWIVVTAGDIAVAAHRPDTGGAERTPPAMQGLVRKEIVPSMLVAIDATPVTAAEATDVSPTAPCLLRLVLEGPAGGPRVLVVERTAEARVVLCAETPRGPRILGVVLGPPRASDGRDLRRGAIYAPPRRAQPPRVVDTSAGAGARGSADGPGDAGAAPPDALAALRGRLRAEARRLKRLEAALVADLARHGDAARHVEEGELLKTVLGRVRRGMATIDVTDWSGAPRVLALDPLRDGPGNLEALFKRARRAREAQSRIEPRLDDVRRRTHDVEQARHSLSQQVQPGADAVARAHAALERPDAGGSPRRKAARAGARKAWRAFRLSDTVVARVGRGARDNDALIKTARGNDLWLHARGHQGAHVIIPASGDELDPALVIDGAHLAAHFSSARGELHVDVQTTRVKHLRKPGPGAPAGLVHVTHESVVHLRVSAERTQRLLAAEVPA